MKLFALYGDLELATKNFNSGVEAARQQMQDLKGEMDGVQTDANETSTVLQSAFGHALGDILSGITQAAIETAFTFATEGVELASSMQETNAKIDTIFGTSAVNIHNWAKTTKESFGIGELSAKTYAAQVAGIISTDSKNLTSQEIEDISTSLVELAGDLASFHNMSFSDTWKKLLSGLRGETEAIEDLGVDLRVSNLADAFGMSTKEWGELDQRTRLLNTYQYIMQETALAQGDFARTSDSYANQLRQLEENIQELKTTFGEALLPVMTDLVSWFNSLFGGAEDASTAMDNIQTSFSNTYATIDTTTANALALVNALSEMEAAGVDTAEEQSVWNALLQNLSETLPGINDLIDSSTGSINGGTTALKNYVTQWQETQREIAIASALQSAQNEVMEQATEVARLQLEYKVAQMTEIDVEAEEARIYGLARKYFGMEGDGFLGAHVDMELIDRAEAGDAYSNYLLKQLEDLWTRADDVAQLESELLAAQAELDDLNARYALLEQQVLNFPVESEQKTETGPTQGETLQAQPLNITLNVTLDGQDISASLVPSVTGAVMGAIDWQLQTKAGG